jgi:hypothetical protein
MLRKAVKEIRVMLGPDGFDAPNGAGV